MDKIEFLTGELAQVAADKKVDEVTEFYQNYDKNKEYSKEEIENLLGFEDTQCSICSKLGATVWTPDCSPDGKKHLFHITCLYNNSIRDTGLKLKSSVYYMVNLHMEMMSVIENIDDYGQRSVETMQSELTIKDFLIARSKYRKQCPDRLNSTNAMCIPLHKEEAVPLHENQPWPRYYIEEEISNAVGYANDSHYNRDYMWQNLRPFHSREMLSGAEFENSGMDGYAPEDGGNWYHSILHTWTEAAKCPRCQTQRGGKSWVSTPCEINPTDNNPDNKTFYGGRSVKPLDNTNMNHCGNIYVKESEDGRSKFDYLDKEFFQKYHYNTLLYKFEVTGRAEMRNEDVPEDENYGMGSLELYTRLNKYMGLRSQGKCNAPILLKPQSDVRPQKRRTSGSDANTNTVSTGFKFAENTAIEAMNAIENIPKSKSAYSLTYEFENGDKEVIGLDFTGEITEKKKENLFKWVKAAEHKLNIKQRENVKQSANNFQVERDMLLRKYNVKRKSEIPQGWKCRFTSLGGVMMKPNWIPVLPPDINLKDFINIIEQNTMSNIDNKIIDVTIPQDWVVGQPLRKSNSYLCWPETVTPKEGSERGKTIQVYIYEDDIEALTDADKKIKMKVHSNLSRKFLFRIEYQKFYKQHQTNFPLVYEYGKISTMNASIKNILKDKFPKFDSSVTSVVDALKYPSQAEFEPFMLRFKNKKEMRNNERFKIKFEFVDDEKNIIKVNKAPMVIDCSYNTPIGFIKEHILAANWFQTKSCWLKLTEDGFPALPDGRPLFYLENDGNIWKHVGLYDDYDFFQDFYSNGALIIEAFADTRVLSSKDLEQDERQMAHTDGHTWKELLYTEDRILEVDDDEDSDFDEDYGYSFLPGKGLMDALDTSNGEGLDIINPWFVSQIIGEGTDKPFSAFETSTSTKYLEIQIPIPNPNKYMLETFDKRYKDDVEKCRKYMKYVEDDFGYRTEIIMSNVEFHDKYLDGVQDIKRCRIPIPGIFFQKLPFNDESNFKWTRKYFSTLSYSANGETYNQARFGGTQMIFRPGINDTKQSKTIGYFEEGYNGYDLVAVKANIYDSEHNTTVDKIIYADISSQKRYYCTRIPNQTYNNQNSYLEGYAAFGEPLSNPLYRQMEMFDNPHLNWGVLNHEMIMQKGINIEEAESTATQRRTVSAEIFQRCKKHTRKKWCDDTNAIAFTTRNGNNAGRLDNYNIIAPGFKNKTDERVERGSRNLQTTIIQEMEDGTGVYNESAEKRCFFKKGSTDVISFDNFMKLGNRSRIELHVYRNLAIKSTEKNDFDTDNTGTAGLSRPIQFQFINCQNEHSIQGSAIHEYFLPDSKPDGKFGFKDREWLSLFPDLLNVYIAEIIYSRKDYDYEKNVPIYSIEEYVNGEWIPHKSTSNIELMNKIKDNIIYVGTTMVRGGDKYRWVHFPKGWNFKIRIKLSEKFLGCKPNIICYIKVRVTHII